jgi:hypothetical protein
MVEACAGRPDVAGDDFLALLAEGIRKLTVFPMVSES